MEKQQPPKFKSFKQSLRWIRIMKQESHKYFLEHNTTVGFDPYADYILAQV